MSPVEDSPPPARLSRRRFATAVGGACAAGLLPRWTPRALARPRFVPEWLADVDGDGVVTARDERILRRAMNAFRGFGLDPARDYDFRADLLARGRVDERDLARFREIRGAMLGDVPRKRPITVAWHYGWYNKRFRPRQTTAYLGGNYLSSDAVAEERFHRLKNECGITVDGLSWISPRKDRRTVRNYRKGYLAAPGLDTRHVALLYESWISLPRNGASRIDFASTDTRGNLVEDFGLMGAFFRNARARGARIFELDRRPVVFVFASHSWVDDVTSEFQFMALDDAMEAARERFTVEYGAPPFVIGEEMPLAPGDRFGTDRARRSENFDGLFLYHHVASPENIIHGGNRLGQAYAKRQQALLRTAIHDTEQVRNRFTGSPLLLVPSLASGFAKDGQRKLQVTRGSYVNYLHEMIAFLEDEYFSRTEFRRSPFPAPVYSLGSWNEEYEGHALFPFAFNRAVKRVQHGGFDISLAIKEVFGWNQYAERPLR